VDIFKELEVKWPFSVSVCIPYRDHGRHDRGPCDSKYEGCPENIAKFFRSKCLLKIMKITHIQVRTFVCKPCFSQSLRPLLQPCVNEKQVCIWPVGTIPCPHVAKISQY
jgi:hypothetical protein